MKTKFISTHDSRIACFTLTLNAQLLATASTKGTLIHIFKTNHGSFLREVYFFSCFSLFASKLVYSFLV
ncbi:hypothetical protein GYH30_019035 [Glycine max]|uniref:Autophagy-related protein 18a n=2 Tax=Glycine subgen. Soja TaxID=1462606 RepID=A0A0R0JCG3_SOYBN|nr:hypothetical protein GYH30_019035 [Glycine max]RZC03838.1 Autophagy-related protein 18a [Glycine soja]